MTVFTCFGMFFLGTFFHEMLYKPKMAFFCLFLHDFLGTFSREILYKPKMAYKQLKSQKNRDRNITNPAAN